MKYVKLIEKIEHVYEDCTINRMLVDSDILPRWGYSGNFTIVNNKDAVNKGMLSIAELKDSIKQFKKLKATHIYIEPEPEGCGYSLKAFRAKEVAEVQEEVGAPSVTFKTMLDELLKEREILDQKIESLKTAI